MEDVEADGADLVRDLQRQALVPGCGPAVDVSSEPESTPLLKHEHDPQRPWGFQREPFEPRCRTGESFAELQEGSGVDAAGRPENKASEEVLGVIDPDLGQDSFQILGSVRQAVIRRRHQQSSHHSIHPNNTRTIEAAKYDKTKRFQDPEAERPETAERAPPVQ